ncbi:hypothetical protein [Leptospira yasudae]|uniref:Uncharacterized protein n=1 Tax=Leptospira yasudae TaxID=2202201 RepID=A0A6N4QJ21_9LEPT|nr:hypothetical protein [Leptospira yasudae]MBW0435012.1 hypothetical protein [Leptospira yasudae]TGL81412.1 hypothetical protein EHQ72_05695 [Leptospira yasudae]TGL81744.1 hypothetical protein EHQ77_06660 [Leptospira yasudae]TGL88120.1 hypothetical protein EHQ83_04025 [Leptospira yasudae]
MKNRFRSACASIALVFSIALLPSILFAEEDAHYIQPDDFFITKEEFKNQPWIHVHLAKQLTAPSSKTKNEAEFLQVHDGNKVWTKFFYATEIAKQSDLKIGNIVIMADLGTEDGYRAPESKDEARTCSWFIAKITDVSDLYKGIVTVSGGYKIKVDAIRVSVKPVHKGK